MVGRDWFTGPRQIVMHCPRANKHRMAFSLYRLVHQWQWSDRLLAQLVGQWWVMASAETPSRSLRNYATGGGDYRTIS